MLLLCTWFSPKEVAASHIAGAEITYECLGGNQYLVRLTAYSDCDALPNTELDPIAQLIRYSSNSCGIATQFDSLYLVQKSEVTPVCPGQLTRCQSIFSQNTGINEFIYEATITLPAQCSDWAFGWALTARNPATTNLPIPGTNSVRIYVETTLDNTQGCNNSPVFAEVPMIYLCDGQPFSIDLGGYDPDGDSLVYEQILPLDYDLAMGNSFPIFYNPPFSTTYPVATSPAFSVGFDAATGLLAFTPSGLQRSIIAILVSEYRNGVLVGTTIRDMTVVVKACANQAPIIEAANNVQPTNALNGRTFSVCIGQTLDFDIKGYEADGGSVFVETNLPSVIPSATSTITNLAIDTFLLNVNWTPTIADIGTYYFSLRAYDDDCPYIGQTSVGYRIVVNVGKVLPTNNILICPSNNTPFLLNASGYDPGVTYDSIRWSSSAQLDDSTIHNPEFDPALGDSADYLVILYPAGGDCPILEQVRIRPDDVILLANDSLRICVGDTVELDARLNSGGTATWDWTPTAGLGNPLSPTTLAFPSTTTTYTVVAITAASCEYQADILVEVVDFPAFDPIGDPLLCSGDTATLSITGSNLTGLVPSWTPVSYLSDTNGFTVDVFPIDTTVYTITVGNECDTISQAIEVRVVPQLSLNISTDDVTCNGLDDGQIEVIPIGGSQSGLTYDWQPNLSSGNIGTSLPPNTYTIAVSDAAGCRDTISGTVDQPTPLLAQVDTLQMVNCFGESNGEVTISGQGGTGSYTYALNGPPFFLDSTFINLPAGAYTVYVQDENGCIDSSQQAVVQEPNQPIDLQLVSIVNANCNTAVGEILVQASGGTPGYTYILNGDTSASPLFQNLLPANYLIEVIDANGCNTLLNVVVVQVSDPRVDLVSSQNPSCFGDSSGTATISIADGLAPYIVDALSGGLPDTTLNSPSTITYNNLPAGVYQVNLIDANNCEFLLTFSLENPDSLYGDVRLIQVPLCSYTADGVALINGIGGTPPYLYAIDNGTPDTNNIFSNLGAGILYTLSLEDSLGCQIEQTVSIQGPPPLVLTPIMEPVSCPGGADGRILLTAIGGKRDYEYSLDDVPFGNRLPFGDDSVYYNLLAGDYISIVQDDNGCLDSLTVTVTEPEPLSISPVVITDVDCYGAASGAIDLFGSGGTAPYQFATNLGNFASINRIGGLREGTYTIIMRDINGCTVDSVVNISQPARLTGSITSQPVICYGDSNGVANVIPQGGTPPYRYFWSNTATTQQVFNLPPGTPTVSVTDDNGCMYVLNTEIQEPPQMQFDTTASEDASCFGIVDGQVLATASGGTDTLSYLWSNGSTDTFQVVGAGVYQIIVTDGNGCTIEDSLEVGQPLEIIIEIMAVQQASCGAPTGEIQVEAMGGLGDVTYQWNTEPPQFGRTATGLYGGPDNIYTVRVIDEQGCENTLDATVGVIGEPTADFQHGFEPLDTILFPSYGVQFINRSLNGSSYRWEFGDGDQSLEEHPDHVYPGPGTYTIQLITIDDGFACPDTTEKTLVLLPPGAIYVPNAFTPNGDAHNQGWSPIGIGVIQVESRIYTRWGKLITTLNSMDEKWYGDLKNGGKAPEGVYVYVVNAVLNDGRTFEQHGMVTLFR